jgi:hypothetical protein
MICTENYSQKSGSRNRIIEAAIRDEAEEYVRKENQPDEDPKEPGVSGSR